VKKESQSNEPPGRKSPNLRLTLTIIILLIALLVQFYLFFLYSYFLNPSDMVPSPDDAPAENTGQANPGFNYRHWCPGAFSTVPMLSPV